MSGYEFDFLKGRWGDVSNEFNRDVVMRNFFLHPIRYAEYLKGVERNRRYGCFYDLSDSIVLSFKRCNGRFSDEEFKFVTDYFMKDFNIALRGGKVCLDDSDKWYKRLLARRSRVAHLDFADVLTSRARETVERAEAILPINNSFFNWNYAASFDVVDRLKRRVSLARSFPDNHRKILGLYDAMESAIYSEDYEQAAVLRDEVKEIVGERLDLILR